MLSPPFMPNRGMTPLTGQRKPRASTSIGPIRWMSRNTTSSSGKALLEKTFLIQRCETVEISANIARLCSSNGANRVWQPSQNNKLLRMQAAGNSLFAFRTKQNSNDMPTAGAVSHICCWQPDGEAYD